VVVGCRPPVTFGAAEAAPHPGWSFKHQHFISSDQCVELGIEEIRVIQGFIGDHMIDQTRSPYTIWIRHIDIEGADVHQLMGGAVTGFEEGEEAPTISKGAQIIAR